MARFWFDILWNFISDIRCPWRLRSCGFGWRDCWAIHWAACVTVAEMRREVRQLPAARDASGVDDRQSSGKGKRMPELLTIAGMKGFDK